MTCRKRRSKKKQ